MAIRKRGGRKKPWEVYWNNPFTLKRESLYVETEEEAKKQDALKKYQLRFERDRFRPEHESVQTKQQHTLESAYYLYLKEKKFGKKSLTWQLDAMKKPLHVLGAKPLDAITTQDLQGIKQLMENENVQPVTVRNRLSVLRTVLRWCHRNELMGTLPRFPELPPEVYKHIVPPTSRELAALWEASPDHIRRVIVLGAMLGVRVGPSEMFRMQWADVDFTQRLVRVQAAKKNIYEPWREIPIRAEILPLLQDWYRADREKGIPYIVNFRGKPVASIKKAWNSALEKASLRNFTPYSLRHAFATNLLSAGVDPGTVAKLMGHRSTDMIFAHYQHVINEQKRRAVEVLPPLPSTSGYVAKNMWQKEKGLHPMM